jgi:hypothetical protein
MKEQKGLVLKKEDDTCFVLTPNGEFKQVSSSKKVQAGEEISIPPKAASFKRILLLAASFSAIFLLWLAYQPLWAQAVNYVSLDFNPSLELGLDGKKKIVTVVPLNQPAKKLLQNLNLKRQPFEKGVEIILVRALENGYLKDDQPQIILAAVAPAKKEAVLIITGQEVFQIVNRALNQASKTKIKVKVVATAATFANHQEAKKTGLSLGKDLLIKAAKKEGKKISVKELKEKNLSEIEVQNQVKVEELFPRRDKTKKPKEKIKEKPGKENKLPKPIKLKNLKAKTDENNLKTRDLPKQNKIPSKHRDLPRQNHIIYLFS